MAKSADSLYPYMDSQLVSLDEMLEPEYSPERKRLAALSLTLFPDLKRAEKESGIPADILDRWAKKRWWQDLREEVRFNRKDELEMLQTRIIHKASEELVDRVENGDFVLDKFGEQHRVPLSGRDLSAIANTFYGQRAALRGETQPTSTEDGRRIIDVLAQKLFELGAATRQAAREKEITIIHVESETNADGDNRDSKTVTDNRD